jgi:hypothetical protein
MDDSAQYPRAHGPGPEKPDPKGHNGTYPGEPRQSFGFSEHVIVGRLTAVKGALVGGREVVNCRVAVSPWIRRDNLKATAWYEVSLWEAQARAFGKLNFKVGDQVLFRLDNVRAEAWLDHEGRPRAAIKGAADKFVDFRPSQGDFLATLREIESEAPGEPLPPAPKF